MNPEDLSRWLPEQRWFAGRNRQIETLSCADVGALISSGGELPHVAVHVVTIRYTDGGEEMYQLPVAYRDRAVPELAHALIGHGSSHGEEMPSFAYDAPQDPAVAGAWWDAIVADAQIDGLSFHRAAPVADLPKAGPGAVLAAEQTNTSLVYGDTVILKLFRRLTAGPSPDVELSRALVAAGNPYVPPVLGWIDGSWRDGSGVAVDAAMGIATAFLPAASGAWEMALASLRALLAEPGRTPENSGADFGSESYRLGEAVAAVHADLARALGSATEPAVAVAAGLTRRLTAAAAETPELRPYVPAIEARYDTLARCAKPLVTQRIHGDLHLGQVLRVPAGWRILDFEGEPGTSVAARTAADSPLKDVAGMLRSFDYAADHLLADRDPEDEALVDRARSWVRHNQRCFTAGHEAGGAVDSAVELEGFLLDKAVYEVVYETRHRPERVGGPLAAIGRMLAEPVVVP